MAVEHKDDTQPIASKLKALQEAESLEGHHENNGKSHTDTDNKENNNNTNNHDNHDNHDTAHHNHHSNGNNKNNEDKQQNNEDKQQNNEEKQQNNEEKQQNNEDTQQNNEDTQQNNEDKQQNNEDEDTEEPATQHNDETNNNEDEEEGDNSSLSQSQGVDAEQPVLESGMEQLGIAEPSNFSVKHPLQNSWTIWYDNPGKRSNQASWGDNLKKITSFGTVEDFWRVFNNLKPASTLAQGSNYHIFKEHIEPKWEDPINSKGGKWTVAIPPKSRNSSLDQMWLYTILACIGETFLSPDDVCGMVVSVRKAGDRVQIWTRDATNEQACRDIGRSLKECLELPANTIIGYQSHADSMKKATKNRYEV